tara:strand:+ start:23037 stop:23615 length:579 start_codon:yes stop_codon:yes gene_type:complete
MGLLRGPDFFYALRFLRLLTMPWEKTAAFKTGVVDENGVRLKKPETKEEKSGYTVFHKLVFNIRRLLGKIPLGKSTIARYAAALYLIKENTGISDKKLIKILKEAHDVDLSEYKPELNEWYLTDDKKIEKGKYALVRDIALPKTGDILALKGSLVEITETLQHGTILGHAVFEAKHKKTQQTIYITQEDITR